MPLSVLYPVYSSFSRAPYRGSPYDFSELQLVVSLFRPICRKCDMWSIGIILYELCTLRRPFKADNIHALALKIIGGKIHGIQPYYSVGLRKVIACLLQRNPLDRPDAAALLQHSSVHKWIAQVMDADEIALFCDPIIRREVQATLSRRVSMTAFPTSNTSGSQLYTGVNHSASKPSSPLTTSSALSSPLSSSRSSSSSSSSLTSTPGVSGVSAFLPLQDPVVVASNSLHIATKAHAVTLERKDSSFDKDPPPPLVAAAPFTPRPEYPLQATEAGAGGDTPGARIRAGAAGGTGGAGGAGVAGGGQAVSAVVRGVGGGGVVPLNRPSSRSAAQSAYARMQLAQVPGAGVAPPATTTATASATASGTPGSHASATTPHAILTQSTPVPSSWPRYFDQQQQQQQSQQQQHYLQAGSIVEHKEVSHQSNGVVSAPISASSTSTSTSMPTRMEPSAGEEGTGARTGTAVGTSAADWRSGCHPVRDEDYGGQTALPGHSIVLPVCPAPLACAEPPSTSASAQSTATPAVATASPSTKNLVLLKRRMSCGL